MNDHHVIRADFNDTLDQEPLYWSDVNGWVSLATATVFSTTQREALLMPLEGRKWMTVGEAIDERIEFTERREEDE